MDSVGKGAIKPPFEPLHESDSREVNYLFIAQKRLGRSANKEMSLLLRNAIGNSSTNEEMSSLVETAAKYSGFLG